MATLPQASLLHTCNRPVAGLLHTCNRPVSGLLKACNRFDHHNIILNNYLVLAVAPILWQEMIQNDFHITKTVFTLLQRELPNQ